MNKTTLAKTPLGTNQANPGEIAVDGTYAYWSSGGGQAILRAPIGGATPFQPIYSTQARDSLLAVDDVEVFWTDQAGMYAAPKAGGGTVRVLPGNQFGPEPGHLSQDATPLRAVPCVVDPRIHPRRGAPRQGDRGALDLRFLRSHASMYFLASAIDASNFYYFQSFNAVDGNVGGPPNPIPQGRLLRQAKAGGPIFTDVVPAPESIQGVGTAPMSMAADGCTVYWSTGTKIDPGLAGRLAAPRLDERRRQRRRDFVLDDTYVYWVDSGWIGRVAR